MVKLEVLDAYDASRDFTRKQFRAICYAPFVSMYFDTLGYVRACCQNTRYTLGNVASERLDDIWRGPRAGALRRALIKNNLKLGCEFCEWQFADGNHHSVFAWDFERFSVASEAPQWPKQIEFSLSNVCNLECVMCNGEWSSSIRARRERLPPLQKAYSEEFFADIRKYLPHLENAKFLGGEPFLAPEPLRICEMMIEEGLSTPCHFTTNGTQYNNRVERILDALPITLAVSMDGLTKETVESIRVNAKHEEVMANFRRFHQYARRRGTGIGLTYCLMRQNWREFGDFLLFADEWDCAVEVNTVRGPVHVSLYTLAPAELAGIVATMEKQDREIGSRLQRNRTLWNETLARLQNHLAHPDSMAAVEPRLLTLEAPADGDGRSNEAKARAELETWSEGGGIDTLRCDADEIIVSVESDVEAGFLGVPPERLVGRPLRDVFPQLRHVLGGQVREISARTAERWQERLVEFTGDNKPRSLVRALFFPTRPANADRDHMVLLAAKQTR
ncbi:MAG: radical SAM protein [Planctomycetota bacterium]